MEEYERLILVLVKVRVARIQLCLQFAMGFSVNDLRIKIPHCHQSTPFLEIAMQLAVSQPMK